MHYLEASKWVEVESEATYQAPEDKLALFTIGASMSPPIKVKVHIKDKPVIMELDTGADILIISESTYQSTFSTMSLLPFFCEWKPVLGKLPIKVQFEDQPPIKQTFVVVTGDGLPLLGRN